MPDQMTIDAPLTGLYPATVRTFFSARLPDSAKLLAEEIGITIGMVEKRLVEFTHGRYCARSAMKLLSTRPAPIGKGPDREPVWPGGIIGSISHTEGSAAAVVAKSAEMIAVGLDMEAYVPLQSDLIPMICLPEENPDQDGRQAKLLFSIKESIYKCLFPLVGEYIDFLEMEVILDTEAQTFSAQPRAARLDADLIARLQGRYKFHSQLVVSAAWISQAIPTGT
jgi:4'-phosphopantetheinyl transferase EntD